MLLGKINICVQIIGYRVRNTELLKVSEYLSIAVALAQAGGQIIRDVHASGDLQRKDKEKDDPVTIADLTVQKTIETALKHHFPGLKVVGEESAKSMQGIDSALDASKLNKELISEALLQDGMAKRKDINQ